MHSDRKVLATAQQFTVNMTVVPDHLSSSAPAFSNFMNRLVTHTFASYYFSIAVKETE
jgi:hypothetical protein